MNNELNKLSEQLTLSFVKLSNPKKDYQRNGTIHKS